MKKFCKLALNLIVGVCLLFVTAAATSPAPMRQTDNSNPPSSVVKLIFIHHSTGENWLRDDYGRLGETLGANNYFVSDTNYGWGPNSIGDRTDIPNWLEWFRSDDTATYMTALFNESDQNSSYTRTLADPGGENEIVMFKSCFPNSALEGSPLDPPDPNPGLTVGHAKYVYNELLEYFATRPDKLFVVITAPPLSDGTYAANARAFNNWLVYNWLWENNYTQSNVAVFDFYNVLTHSTYHHRFYTGDIQHYFGNWNTLYYPSGDDHPSIAGSRKATTEFIPLLNVYYRRWKAGARNVAVLTNRTLDGWVLESSETSNVGGTMNSAASTFRLGDDAQDRQYRAILSFNTAAIPDNAVLLSVTLKIRRSSLVGTDPFNTHGALRMDVRKGEFNGNAALELADFRAAATQSSVATFNKTNVMLWYNAVVPSANFGAFNLVGLSQVRLRFSTDDNNDNGADYRNFLSGNSAYKPVLWITYYEPSGGDLLLQPSDFEYLGAFRLPDDESEFGWMWSGEALTYYPQGDPSGDADGFPGSLFGTGHNWNTYVSEVNIPPPIISRNLADLETAATLQSFRDIRAGLFDYLEIPRVGLEYLPTQGAQTSGKLYFSWAQHMGEEETLPTHGWSNLTLSTPQTAGAWRIGTYWNYVTGDYLLAIPSSWADIYAPGKYLATGRFRDGGQGALGPSLFAIAPWESGNPPASDATLPATPLLLYGNVYTVGAPAMDGYSHADEWMDAEWLTAGSKSAVIFIGTKGIGNTWYGCKDGTVWPDDPPYPPECPERGWWSESFESQILFYDPSQLGAVARGNLPSWEPQPYAVLRIDNRLFNVTEARQKAHVASTAFDRERGLLYVMEPLVDEDKPIIHVWRIQAD
ncbi:MAG: hypothetical protein ACOYZ6_02005 [Chloroflexota bacterium]